MRAIVLAAVVNLALAQQVPPPVPPRAPVPRIDVRVDQKGADFRPWVRDFVAQALTHWDVAPEQQAVAGHVRATFRVSRNGVIHDVSLTAADGLDAVKTAVAEVLTRFQPRQSLPDAYSDDSASCSVIFYYQEPPPEAPMSPLSVPADVHDGRAGASQGLTQPRLVRDVKPPYTSEAMRAKISGTSMLSAIVETDGSVSNVAVIRSLDPWLGLDESAVQALKQWQFTPGMRDGAPVRTLVTVEMMFTLR